MKNKLTTYITTFIAITALGGGMILAACGDNTTEATPEVLEQGYDLVPINEVTTTAPRTDRKPDCASDAEATQGVSGAWYCKKKYRPTTTRAPR